MTSRALLELNVTGYKSLQSVRLPLGNVTVLVGPNGAGKSNVLDVFRFLGDAAREDLVPAINQRGGIGRLAFRGSPKTQKKDQVPVKVFSIGVKAVVTANASETAPDEYTLRVRSYGGGASIAFRRSEFFKFKRRQGRGRRLTLSGSRFALVETGEGDAESPLEEVAVQDQSILLSTLPKLAPKYGGEQISKFAKLFLDMRVFDVSVELARQPSPVRANERLGHDAWNLASFLMRLSKHQEIFAALVRDARQLVPGLRGIHFRKLSGAEESVVVELEEQGLSGHTPLADASYGTVRILSLLALLYDPAPPRLTCIEEVDHGIHPWAFDRIADLIREASARTQFVLVTHSPAFVNRLKPHEMVVCERDPQSGASRIPAITQTRIKAMIDGVGGGVGLGELWFTGSLGGVPEETI